jgi:tRNA-Thr(GGU) m(6)t(6)A37 methyltransferase TsaA
MAIEIEPIGTVRSPLRSRAQAPRQAHEGAPEAWIEIEPRFAAGLRDLQAGDAIFVLTWLDRSRRDVLQVHPRGDLSAPLQGVFSTRSPDRPNPIGLHRTTVVAVEAARLRVEALEALEGTPVLDLKPVLLDVQEA